MGFKLGAFVEGFATQAAEQIQADKKNARDTYRIAYSNWLDKREEETKTRRTQQKELETLGNTMKNFLGLDDAQTLTVLENGPEYSKFLVNRMIEAKQSMGDAFDPNDLVRASSESGIELEEGISRLMGSLDTEGLGELPGMGEGNIFFDPQKAVDREKEQLEGMFGITAEEARAGARGQYKREDLGIEGTIDIGALYTTDPMDALRREQLELQIAKLKESDDEDTKLTDGNIRGYINELNRKFTSELGVEITSSTDPETGKTSFATTGGTAAQRQEALRVAYESTEKLEDYLKSGDYESRTKALNAAVDYGMGILNKKLITPAGATTSTGAVEQPASTVDQKGGGPKATTEQTGAQSNYDPATQTPAQFAKAEAERRGLASESDAAARADIKRDIKAQLKARGVSEDDALKAVRGL